MEIHVVTQGETLYRIAKEYNLSAQRIITDNGLTYPYHLAVGQALLLTRPAQVHTVRPGDTIYGVANDYGMTGMELVQNNPNLIAEPVLYPGQQLTIAFDQPKGRQITISGYAYPFIDRRVLRRTLPYLTYLGVFAYGFREDGSLVQPDDRELIAYAYEAQTAPVLVFSSIDDNDVFSSTRAKNLFWDLELQNTVLDHLIAVMHQKGYVGLDADFEYIEAADGEAYLRFLENAGNRLRLEGFFLHTDLAPKTFAEQPGLLYEAHDYARIGALSDTVLLMTYEWGYTYGPPMAVAPIHQVRPVIRFGVEEIPREKILMGMPNYGYDWTLPFEKGVSRAESLGNQAAVQRAVDNGAVIQYDQTAQSPYFYYWKDGREHVVWFEDVRSISAKLDLNDEFGLLGCGYWNVMRPFAQNWALLSLRYHIRKVV